MSPGPSIEYGEFLRRHIGRWLPGFCRAVTAQTREEYYRVIGRLGAAFLERELTQLSNREEAIDG